jgi:hypothetical protein
MEQAERTAASAHPYIRSDRVEGTAVYDANGGRIGTIKYLEIERSAAKWFTPLRRSILFWPSGLTRTRSPGAS